jgi:hypothetical protein
LAEESRLQGEEGRGVGGQKILQSGHYLLSNAGSSILAVLVVAAGETGGGGAIGEAPKLKGDGGGGFFFDSKAELVMALPKTLS